MSLTDTHWLGSNGGGDDTSWADPLNWGDGVAGVTNNAYFDLTESAGRIPQDGTSQTVGELTIAEGLANGFDFADGSGVVLTVLGDINANDVPALSIYYMGGTFTGDGGLFENLGFVTLDGTIALSQMASVGQLSPGLTVLGGSGRIIFDLDPDSDYVYGISLIIDSSFTGTIQSTIDSLVDLQGIDFNAAVVFLPNRSAFTNFTGGAPDSSNTAVIAGASSSGAINGICIF